MYNHFIKTNKYRYTRRERVDNRIILNRNFNPQSSPSRLLEIQRPVFDYRDEERRSRPLTIVIFPREFSQQVEQLVSNATDTFDWYSKDVSGVQSYIDAAFRSVDSDEAFLFMKDEYVRLDYAPGTTDDKILNGPLLISDGFQSLQGTSFADYGIDCAFAHGNEAFIFSGNLCAKMHFEPGTTNDMITKGPMTITKMFPFFKGTVFAEGVDAAFESSKENEAYIFKGSQYSRINFATFRQIDSHSISGGFHPLKGTIFESGIDAAFASHYDTNEAYLFKGNKYALLHFSPGSNTDYLIGGVKEIAPNWPSLAPILPRANRGLDIHDQNEAKTNRDHDEL